jgi:hypothetical protein
LADALGWLARAGLRHRDAARFAALPAWNPAGGPLSPQEARAALLTLERFSAVYNGLEWFRTVIRSSELL